MAYAGQQMVVTVVAGVDLRQKQYWPVKADGTLVASGGKQEALGVVQNKPNSGQHATLVVGGRTKFFASIAINAGVKVSINNSGYFVPGARALIHATSGTVTNPTSNILHYGTCITSVASGGIGTMEFGGPDGIGT